MKVNEIVIPLEAEVVVDGNMSEQTLKGGYSGDLLSDCIANAGEGSVWVTIHSHPNIVAVAVLVGILCIVITNFQEIDPQTVEKARKERVTLLRTPLTSYQAVAVLAGRGIPGTKKHV
ncbi:MAG: hypothetical protein NTX88_12310 [Candidatus Atribacteria bacterium]|nr:hypothetical protein [Candidatus Atribacteria bacterium]